MYQSNFDHSETVNNPALLLSLFLFTIAVCLISYVVYSLLLGKIFEKAGVPKWIAWVPFYSTWKTLEIGGQPGYWAVLMIVPFVNYVSLVFYYIALYNIGKKLEKQNGWWLVLAIFVPIVWFAILGFDSSKWQEVAEASTPNNLPTPPKIS